MRVHMPITLSRLSLYKEDTTGNSLYKTETWIVDLPHARWQPCHRAILGCLYVAIKIYYITYGLKIIVWEGIVDGAHIDWLLHNRLCNRIENHNRTNFGNPGCQSRIPKFHAQDVCLDKTQHVEMEVASMVQDILHVKLSKAHTNYSWSHINLHNYDNNEFYRRIINVKIPML